MGDSDPAFDFATRPFLLGCRWKPEPGGRSGFPFSLSAVRDLESLKLDREVTFLVGENGSGKSTLLEALAVSAGFNAEGGSRNFNFASRASHSELHRHIRLVRGHRRPRTGFFLRAESFYNVATEIERLDRIDAASPALTDAYGGGTLHERSHGEAFLQLLRHRFGPEGLYFLDEPESALSPQRQLSALVRMRDLVAAGSQFIVATHSPILMAYPGSRIYLCGDEGLSEISYEETEHVRITRRFLRDPRRALEQLFSGEDQDAGASP